MGNSVCGKVEIQLDHEEGHDELRPLPAGSVLSGKIRVDLSRDVENPQESVVLHMHGKEKVHMSLWSAKKTPGDTSFEIPKTTAERNIMSVKLEWPGFPGDDKKVRAGSYAFPFQLQLPRSLPSSTYHPVDKGKNKSSLSFHIQYKLQAVFGGTKTQKHLWITAAVPHPPPEPVPCMVEPITHELQSGLFSRGNFIFAASLQDCNIQDSIRLNVSCRNDSNIEVTQIVVAVMEQLRWGTDMVNHVDPITGICTKSATLSESHKLAITTLRNIKLPGLVRQSKGFLQSAMDTVMGSPEQRLQQEIHNELLSGENMIVIQVPNIRHSYSGQLIQVSHYLRVEFQTSSSSPNPILEIPIHILGRGKPAPSNQIVTGAGKAYCAELKHKPKIKPVTGLAPTSSNTPSSIKESSSSSSPGKEGDPPTNEQQVPIMATAVQIHDEDTSFNNDPSPVVIADAIILGGDARQRSGRRLQDLVPLAPPTTGVVSIGCLLQEMRASIDEYDLLTSKLEDATWIDLFETMSAEDYGTIVSYISVETDQPKVAVLLASYLEPGLTCEYAAAAVRNASSQHRANMTQQLLKLVTDRNFHLIRAELNEWEQTVTNSAFEKAEKEV